MTMNEASFSIHGENRPSRWLVTCDHASNRVPGWIGGGDLGIAPADMARHIAWDPGAAGVARALAADPPVLLMDEPFGAVDPIARDRLQAQFREIATRLEKTVVLVTHDVDEAVRMSDRIAVLAQGGVLQQYANFYVGGTGDLAVVVLLAVVLLTRPSGLMGKRVAA